MEQKIDNHRDSWNIIRDKTKDLLKDIGDLCPDNRARSLALDSLGLAARQASSSLFGTNEDLC